MPPSAERRENAPPSATGADGGSEEAAGAAAGAPGGSAGAAAAVGAGSMCTLRGSGSCAGRSLQPRRVHATNKPGADGRRRTPRTVLIFEQHVMAPGLRTVALVRNVGFARQQGSAFCP